MQVSRQIPCWPKSRLVNDCHGVCVRDISKHLLSKAQLLGALHPVSVSVSVSLSSDALYLQFELPVTTSLVETPHAVQRPAEPHWQDCKDSLQMQQTLVCTIQHFVDHI